MMMNMKMAMFALAFRGLLVAVVVVDAQEYTDGALFRENFETRTVEDYTFSGNGVTQSTPNGNILRTRYPPTAEGSPRLTRRTSLTRSVPAATLSFDMKLDRDFEFARGGKLHGLGGGTGTTGGGPVDRNGWSLRLMWWDTGVPNLYVYDQDRQAEIGDHYNSTTGFEFGKNIWYRIDLQVVMNSAVNVDDGYAVLFVDGVREVRANNLRLTGSRAVQIDQFLFNTFYGGGDSSWSPSKTTYAYFDNFVVMPGKIVTGEQGKTCELNKAGIYNFGTKLCCAKTCQSCGGIGCGSLPGGASRCCGRAIVDTCSSGAAAPCKFGGAPVVVPVSVPAAAPVPYPVLAPVPVPVVGIDHGKLCEKDKGGLFHPSTGVCCAQSCGICGGVGCSNRDGGADHCCTGEIAMSCARRARAPCKWY
jgi:hypothetical protein